MSAARIIRRALWQRWRRREWRGGRAPWREYRATVEGWRDWRRRRGFLL